jgi:glycerate dehydrogenase
MRIVVTDAYPLNPGDLTWESISALGKLITYDRTPAGLIIERSKDADIILTNKVPFSKDILDELAELKLINVLATGYDIIDINAAKQKGVTVCNVPAYGTASVAQHAFALLLELTNHTGLHAASTAAGKWQQSEDWCYTESPIMELSGKTFGIVGFGNIGQQTAKIAKAFGMNVIYYSLSKKETTIANPSDLETLFTESDVISLHCPLRKDNHQFVNRHLLQMMKSTAFLINTSRGQLIHEQDLADALNNAHIAGAALDVLSAEPPRPDNPLLTARNCIITPHNAWMSKEARQRILDITVNNIEAFLNGTPVNVVS